MINKLLAGTAMAVVPAVAMAADLPVRGPAPAPVFVQAAPTWGGFYVGMNAGVVWSQVNGNGYTWDGSDVYSGVDGYPATTSSNSFGGLAGVTAGYNFQSGNFVFGIEGDIGGVFGQEGRSGVQFYSRYSHETTALGTIRARIGYANSATLFYLTAGAAAVRQKAKVDVDWTGDEGKGTSKSEWKWAPVAGVGIEHQLGGGWSAKVEGLYVFDSSFNVRGRDAAVFYNDSGSYGKGYKGDSSHAIIRFGVNYRFGAAASGPVIARY